MPAGPHPTTKASSRLPGTKGVRIEEILGCTASCLLACLQDSVIQQSFNQSVVRERGRGTEQYKQSKEQSTASNMNIE